MCEFFVDISSLLFVSRP